MAVPPTVRTPSSLYVGDLHADISDGQLIAHFSDFKSLASVRVCRDLSTSCSLCYGYVNFFSPQDVIQLDHFQKHFKDWLMPKKPLMLSKSQST